MHRRHSWVPFVAAVGGTVFFVKGVLAGWREDVLSEGVMALLYFGGIALSVAALVGLGLRQPTLLRRVGLALGLPVLFLVWVMGLGAVLEPLVRVFTDSQTAQLETRIVVAGLAVLAVAWLTWNRDQREAVLV